MYSNSWQLTVRHLPDYLFRNTAQLLMENPGITVKISLPLFFSENTEMETQLINFCLIVYSFFVVLLPFRKLVITVRLVH